MRQLTGAVALAMALFSISAAAVELEKIPDAMAQEIGRTLMERAAKLEKLPFEIPGDAAKANGYHLPRRLGILLVPAKDLAESAELAAKFQTDPGAPLAYLFLYNVVPVVDGKRVDPNRLRKVKIEDGDGNMRDVYVLWLAIRQPAADDYRLHGYSAEPKPLIDARFSAEENAAPTPVGVELMDANESTREGRIVVTVFGKYQASFPAAYTGDP